VFYNEVEVSLEGVVRTEEVLMFIGLSPLFDPSGEEELIFRLGESRYSDQTNKQECY